MAKFILFLLSLFAFQSAICQSSCPCQSDLKFLITQFESGYPGFSINTKGKRKRQYASLKGWLKIEAAKNCYSYDSCLLSLQPLPEFFIDNHLRLYDTSLVDEEAYEASFKTTRMPSMQVLENDILYLRFPSFNYRLWEELDSFYLVVEDSIQVYEKLIVDIRNNGGGGVRMYKGLLKIIKSKKVEDVVILFNNKCYSACEEVAMKVSKIKKVSTAGTNTAGAFAFGFINVMNTPNFGYGFIITTKSYPKRFKYERVGIAPQTYLSDSLDWITEAEQMFLDKE